MNRHACCMSGLSIDKKSHRAAQARASCVVTHAALHVQDHCFHQALGVGVTNTSDPELAAARALCQPRRMSMLQGQSSRQNEQRTKPCIKCCSVRRTERVGNASATDTPEA